MMDWEIKFPPKHSYQADTWHVRLRAAGTRRAALNVLFSLTNRACEVFPPLVVMESHLTHPELGTSCWRVRGVTWFRRSVLTRTQKQANSCFWEVLCLVIMTRW